MAAAIQTYTVADTGSLSNTVTINKPSGVASGDLLVFVATTFGTTPTTLTSSGFTVTKAPSGFNVWVGYRIADGSEGSTFSITRSGTNTSTFPALMFRVTGHDSSTPVVDFDGNYNASGTSCVINSVTAGAASLLVSTLFKQGNIAPTSTAPSGMATAVDDSSAANSAAAYSYQSVSSGATGSKTWTSSSNAGWAGGNVIIKDAPPVPKQGSGTVTAAQSTSGTGTRTPKGSGTTTAAQSTSGTGVRVPKGSGTASAAQSSSGTGTQAPKAAGTVTASQSTSGTGATTPKASGTVSASQSTSGSGVFDPEGSGTVTAASSVSGTGEEPLVQMDGQGTVTAASSTSGSGITTRSGSGAAVGTSALSATGSATHRGSGSTSATSAVSGTGTSPDGQGSGTVVATSSTAGTGYRSPKGHGTASQSASVYGSGPALPVQTVQRWSFYDPSTDETWTFPINPDAMSPIPHVTRNLRFAFFEAPGQTAIRTFAAPPQQRMLEWTGWIHTQDQYENLWYWAAKTVEIQVTDHLDRKFTIFIKTFEPDENRRASRRLPWRMRYKMSAILLGVNESFTGRAIETNSAQI